MEEQPKSRFPSSAVWTAIFTAVLTVVAFLQWRAYQEANDLTAANERALVSVSGPIWSGAVSADGKSLTGLQIQYIWSNSGRSPAKKLISEINFSLGDTRPVAGLNFNNLQEGNKLETVIGPSGQFQPNQINMSVDDLRKVADGREHLFFWGWAIYDDGLASTPRRLTEFCTDVAAIQFNGDDLTKPTLRYQGNWPPCPVHNCYDEQCEDYPAMTKQYP